ncbi:uncharacterized protein I303_108000 [Kwoniella dejecticola CBS 10117]|uniref:Sodium/calcium exchanger membrane region domain-containing protein n=1 Tax=Kwoniella dejecticola CBS 10117 TaxID=1296121 RepID=A0A1A5ZW92_9TREE|nr:uncharacterized protein I303_07991 [Kwoniella dejecticola CBS 10117]OBR82077.1 hypothetical protein I303_07991 [Kwoniella dejecticola CBS 10117]
MPAQLRSKRAWLLLTASVTLHIFLLTNTRIIGDRTSPPPHKKLLRRLNITEATPAESLLELPYQEWYEQLPPALKPFYIIFLLVVLAFLFSFIGISASDFFCPNLSTIASYLGLNESTAGVTFLAFGNGSPDVFSTFSAMKNDTVGLAIGELIGAASFIVSIVVGSIAFIRPFHVPRHAFLRDVLFFTSAVCLLVLVLRDGFLSLYEAGSMVLLYVTYVGVVVGGNWLARRRRRKASHDHLSQHQYQHKHSNHKSPILNGSQRSRRSSTYSSPHLSPVPEPLNIDENEDEDDEHTLHQTPGEMTPVRPNLGRIRSHTSASYLNAHTPHRAHLHHHDSIDTPRANFSLLGAIEFRDVVNSLRKESNSRSNSPGRSPGERAGEPNDYFGSVSTVGHRRSSSYGFNSAIASSGTLPRRTDSKKGRRRASTHSDLGESSNATSRSVSSPFPSAQIKTPQSTATPNGLGASPEPNPWEDQEGNPPTPALSIPPPSQLTVPPTIPKPSRPKVIIPDSEQRVHLSQPSVPSISVVDPSGHTDIPTATSPPIETPPLKFLKQDESRFAVRRKSRMILRVLFPSLQSFRHKSWIGMILAITSVPAILALTLTLPVVDDGCREEGGIALPTAEDEGLNDPEAGYDEAGDEDQTETEDEGRDLEEDEMEEESNGLLNPEIGEELHHLVDHGFSPLHSPLGRISHGSLRRLNSHLEAGDLTLDDITPTGEGGTKEEEEDLYEELNEERGLEFNKWLTATQCVLGPMFCITIMFNDQSYFYWVLLASFVAGILAALATLYYATDGSSYTWRLVRCFCGFTCSMVWIAAIADEVVSVLDTVGEILGLSDAIIGLTMGNSLADLVANVTVAQFAPAMAYAACFGGPMLNLLLGVGGSGTYQILLKQSYQPIQVHFSPTLWVSSAGLIFILLSTSIIVPLNNYLIDRRWATCLIFAYVGLMCLNVAVEIRTGRK